MKLLINLYFCEIFSAFATVNWRNYAANQTGGILSTAAFCRVPRYCFTCSLHSLAPGDDEMWAVCQCDCHGQDWSVECSPCVVELDPTPGVMQSVGNHRE